MCEGKGGAGVVEVDDRGNMMPFTIEEGAEVEERILPAPEENHDNLVKDSIASDSDSTSDSINIKQKKIELLRTLLALQELEEEATMGIGLLPIEGSNNKQEEVEVGVGDVAMVVPQAESMLDVHIKVTDR